MHSDHSFWPWHEFGMFPGFFFLLFLIVVFLLARNLGRGSSRNNSSTYKNTYEVQKPIDVLKMRLAKGEIDQEEFEKIKKTLSD